MKRLLRLFGVGEGKCDECDDVGGCCFSIRTVALSSFPEENKQYPKRTKKDGKGMLVCATSDQVDWFKNAPEEGYT